MKLLTGLLLFVLTISNAFSDDFIHIGDKIDSLPENLEQFQKGSVAEEKFSLEAIKGKKALLFYFLKPGCGSCDEFSPHLYRLFLKNKEELAIVGVSGLSTSDAESVKEFSAHCLGEYIVLRDPSHKFVEKMIGKIDKFPYLLLTDKEGKVVWYGRGKFHEQVTAEVNRVLGKEEQKENIVPQKRYVLVVGAQTGNQLKAVKKNTALMEETYKGKSEFYLVSSGDNKDAPGDTVSAVRTKFTEIAAKAGEKDSILFYFTGESLAIALGEDKCSLNLQLSDGTLSLTELIKILKANSKCNNVLFAIDANHADSKLKIWEDIAPQLAKEFTDPCIILSAARWDYSNLNETKDATIFTEYLIKAVKNDDTNKSAYELWRSIRDSMSKWSRKNGILQSPFIINADKGNFSLSLTSDEQNK